jgi:hypothetical protein
MKYISRISLALMVIALITGCDEDNSGTGTQPITYTYREVVHFNSSEYTFVKRDYPNSLSKIPEPLVNWEQSLGEPFTDMNGNGIYEPGIDSFTISPDPSINQDLNENGQYDSPDDPWEVGIPFDDIDGNGQYRPDPGNHTTGYEPGLPYADFNNNGKHDGDLKAKYDVAQWRKEPYYLGGSEYLLSKVDSAVYRFVSDSGLNYDLYLLNAPIVNKLLYADTALACFINFTPVQLLKRGVIEEEDSTTIEIPAYPEPIIYYRWVTTGEYLNVDGISFSGLVKVRIGDSDYRWDFYFSHALGLIAHEFWKDLSPSTDWVTYERSFEAYFKRFGSNHSLVFPTRR